MYPHKGAFPPMGAAAPNIAPANMSLIGDANQWMSQSAYQNIDLDKVDWAVLAQQWIHMKESCTVVGGNEASIPCAPPPPRFTNAISNSNSNDYEEQGEAPMEVEHEDEQIPNQSIINVTAPPPPTNIFNTSSSSSSSSNNWNSNDGNSNSRGHQKHWNRSKNNPITV